MAKRTITEIQDVTLSGFANAIRNSKFDKYNGIAESFAPRKSVAVSAPTVRFSLNAMAKAGIAALPTAARITSVKTPKRK